jgi:tRNA(adenine34) deaminase
MNPKAGCAGSILNILDMPEFNHQVETVRGVMEEECSLMLRTFFKELRIRNKKEKEEISDNGRDSSTNPML